MQITEVSSREFNRESSRVKRQADEGPVFITDHGVRAHVIMSVRHYEALKARRSKTLLQAVAQAEGAADVEFDVPRADIALRPVDLD